MKPVTPSVGTSQPERHEELSGLEQGDMAFELAGAVLVALLCAWAILATTKPNRPNRKRRDEDGQ